MAAKKPPKGREGMGLPVPGPREMTPNSRNPEYRGGGDREVLCYAQPYAPVMDLGGSPQSTPSQRECQPGDGHAHYIVGSETPSRAMFVANRGSVASKGASGRDTAKDTRMLTHQGGIGESVVNP